MPQLSEDIEEITGFNPKVTSLDIYDEDEDEINSWYEKDWADLFKSFDN